VPSRHSLRGFRGFRFGFVSVHWQGSFPSRNGIGCPNSSGPGWNGVKGEVGGIGLGAPRGGLPGGRGV